MDRPEYIRDEHLEYLDGLRKLGATNTFGMDSLLMRKFPNLTNDEGAKTLMYWVESFRKLTIIKKIIKFLRS